MMNSISLAGFVLAVFVFGAQVGRFAEKVLAKKKVESTEAHIKTTAISSPTRRSFVDQ